MILGNIRVTNVNGATDKADLSINGTKVISSEYGQKDIKSIFPSRPVLLNHPYYWAAFSLIGNPW